MDTMTIAEFKSALPEGVKKSVNQGVIDYIDNTLSDPEMYETFRENLLGYSSVMTQGKFKIESYINAVKYTSYKMRNLNNRQAFQATFPDKMSTWAAAQMSDKDINSYVSAYNKSKLVIAIAGQAMIPTSILNQDVFQDAINVQARIMNDEDASFKVRSDAANSLLTHLKAPETKQVELNIGIKQDSSIDKLRKLTEELVSAQRGQLESGRITAHTLAAQPLSLDVVAEVEDGEFVDG